MVGCQSMGVHLSPMPSEKNSVRNRQSLANSMILILVPAPSKLELSAKSSRVSVVLAWGHAGQTGTQLSCTLGADSHSPYSVTHDRAHQGNSSSGRRTTKCEYSPWWYSILISQPHRPEVVKISFPRPCSLSSTIQAMHKYDVSTRTGAIVDKVKS